MDIEADAVSVVIDGQEIIQAASLTCSSGTMTALVGPSGCGKTTLLHCLGLLQRPTAGRVLVDGTDTTGWSASRRRRFWKDHGAFVLQDYGVMEEESVAFNVAMRSSLIGSKVIGDRERLNAALDATGLSGRHAESAAHLSGGEKQRLSIARAMYKEAHAVFVDEPTASLDGANRARVIELFATLAQRGCTVIVATHDAEMMSACDRQHQVGRSAAASSVVSASS
jgi:putative ABC transport system ATP-binding protein